MTSRLYMLCLTLAGFITAMTSAVSANAIEEPAYTATGQVGDVELRVYEPTIQARTRMGPAGEEDSEFRRLAGYIFGGNATEQSIAMTAPVETRDGDDGFMAL